MDARLDHLPRRIARAHRAAGPFSFLNPTTRYLPVPAAKVKRPAASGRPSTAASGAPEAVAPGAAPPPPPPAEHDVKRQHAAAGQHVHGLYQIWRSRDNRKGRHAVVLTHDFFRHHHVGHGAPADAAQALDAAPDAAPGATPATDSWRGVGRGLWNMAVRYPLGDVSYDVALLFTLGSAVWVVNSFFVWLPLAAPATAFAGETTWAGGISAVVGATIFEVGAVLGVLEAVNENRADCFGWALEEALESGMLLLRPSPDACRHAHAKRGRFFGGGGGDSGGGGGGGGCSDGGDSADSSGDSASDDASPDGAPPARRPRRRRWTWWPAWSELRAVYAREMGFWACLIQLVGATVFWISGFTGLPPVTRRLSTAATDGIFWLPQVVGGLGFVVSSAMFMFETQRAWYVPAPRLLGWHIGLWNFVGAVGFTLCGALGFGAASSSAVAYASTLSTFIGSWAFLIGSVIQWYESLDKYPIQIQASLPDAARG